MRWNDDLVPGKRRAVKMTWFDLRRWLATRVRRGAERLDRWLSP